LLACAVFGAQSKDANKEKVADTLILLYPIARIDVGRVRLLPTAKPIVLTSLGSWTMRNLGRPLPGGVVRVARTMASLQELVEHRMEKQKEEKAQSLVVAVVVVENNNSRLQISNQQSTKCKRQKTKEKGCLCPLQEQELGRRSRHQDKNKRVEKRQRSN